MDCGYPSVVVNAEKVKYSPQQSKAAVPWYTGHPRRSSRTQQWRDPDRRILDRVIMKAVERMVPAPPWPARYGHLRVYAGPSHPHEAQSPTTLDVWPG